MKFFEDIKKSVYSPSYYGQLLQKPFSYSLKYFFLLIVCLTLLYTVLLAFTVIPKIASGIGMIESGILQHYPDHLEVTISKGKASSNVKEPYFIKSPTKNDIKNQMPALDNILVIDTKSEFSLDQFKSYKTDCILNHGSFACYDKQGEIKVVDLSKIPDYTINQAVISGFFAKLQPFIIFIYPVALVFCFIGLFFIALFHLVCLLFAALLIWLVAKINKVAMNYKKSYQVGLHLLTLPLILTFLINGASLFTTQVHSVFLLPTVVLVVMAFLNIKNQGEQPIIIN